MTYASTIGARDDYFRPQFQGFMPRKSSVAQEIGDGEAQAENRQGKVRRTFHRSETVISFGSPTAEATEVDADFLNVAEQYSELDEIRGHVRSFASMAAGWDGPDSIAALDGVVDDALEVLQNWARDIEIPEPVLAYDGTLALEIYDDDGLTRGGIEFKGLHKAVYTVISETELVTSGTFNADSPSEIIRSIGRIRRALSSK